MADDWQLRLRFHRQARPHVSHDEGTRLVVEFIEKFWCPTVKSEELVGSGEG